MTMWVGLITLAGGIALWFTSRRERGQVPAWFPRLSVGICFLGVSTLLLSREGTAFALLSAAFSLVSITLLVSIIWKLLRRR